MTAPTQRDPRVAEGVFPYPGHRTADGGGAGSLCACGAQLGPRSTSGSCRTCSIKIANAGAPVPADFAEHAPHATYSELQTRYRVGVVTLQRWRRESGIPAPFQANKGRPSANQKPIPQGFALVAPTMTIGELRTRYSVGGTAIHRWLAETGVKPCRANAPMRRPLRPLDGAGKARATVVVNNRDMSRAGQAADYLKPNYIPVHRASADGAYDQRGTHWRCGRLLLTDAEIVERALRRGWDPDGWKRLGNAA